MQSFAPSLAGPLLGLFFSQYNHSLPWVPGQWTEIRQKFALQTSRLHHWPCGVHWKRAHGECAVSKLAQGSKCWQDLYCKLHVTNLSKSTSHFSLPPITITTTTHKHSRTEGVSGWTQRACEWCVCHHSQGLVICGTLGDLLFFMLLYVLWYNFFRGILWPKTSLWTLRMLFQLKNQEISCLKPLTWEYLIICQIKKEDYSTF